MGPDLVVVVVVGGDDVAVVYDGSGIVIVAVVVCCGGILFHKLAFIYRNCHRKNFLFYSKYFLRLLFLNTKK